MAHGIRTADGVGFAVARGPCVPILDFEGATVCIERVISDLEALSGAKISRDRLALALSSAGIDSQSVRIRFERVLRSHCTQVILVSDGEAALFGCVGDRDGAVICIGTGVVAYSRRSGYSPRTLDGWGWPAGDFGGGAFIGRRAVEEFLHAVDSESVDSDLLLQRLATVIGCRREEISAWLEAAGRRQFAALAKTVAEAGCDGSALGVGLLAEAGGHITSLVAVLTAMGHSEVNLTGGLATAIAPFVLGDRLRIVPGASLAGVKYLAGRWMERHASTNVAMPK